MAKKEQKAMTDEATNDMPSDIGQVDVAGIQGQVATFDAFENIPTLVPGKNFEEGMTVKGRFKLTKRVYSEKFTAGKKDKDGRKYRDLHVLVDGKGRNFGIWSVGKLAAALMHLVAGDYIEITYEGKDEAALRPGQSPAHNFSLKGVGVNGQPLVADWNRIDEEEELPSGTGYQTAGDARGSQAQAASA